MTIAAILLATFRFLLWEAPLLAAGIRLARFAGLRDTASQWLAILAVNVTLEASIAGALSFAGWNTPWAYWVFAAICALSAIGLRKWPVAPLPPLGLYAALTAPLILLSFRPVEEIDSINYLHYLIDWMANRATPYVFATNYVAFWELSFLPAWIVTRVDLFFPLLALKAVAMLGLALWLVGRELGLHGRLLGTAVFGALLMRHYWVENSGVPTLKNDALHGAGFLLLTLVLLHLARRPLTPGDLAFLAFGVAFASVKYTGIFFAALVLAVVWWRAPGSRRAVLFWPGLLFLLTSGHYYLHNLLRYGSPFYPFQLNFGPLHLPGAADLSYSSILYNLHDPRLWRALFLPAGGISPAGVLFPAILAGALLASAAHLARALRRRAMTPPAWTAFALLCGWLLYFRSVYSACAAPGDLAFLVNNLNSIRYVDGVLALSELLLVALLASRPWLAAGLIALNAASRLWLLYRRETLPLAMLLAAAALALLIFTLPRLRTLPVALLCLVIAGPFLVESNRPRWTVWWNDLKPALARVRGPDLATLAVPEGGYFAGHVVAAGNPVDPRVRSLSLDEVRLARPRYLALLVTPGADAAAWRARYLPTLLKSGYKPVIESSSGELWEFPKLPLQ